MNSRIVFTGGGTAGHVTPNIALINKFKEEGWDVDYVGSADGIEQGIISKLGIPFYAVSSGKLRRYFSLKNLLDPFKVILGVIQSFRLFRKLKPNVVFSKGGFVAFPVVVGAWLNRIPVVAHESDITPGLANRMSFPFVSKICLTFDAAKEHFNDQAKIETTGTPIRSQLFLGNAAKGFELCLFHDENKPCLLVLGGSLGANSINHCIRAALPQLTEHFQVIHVCGKGKLDESLIGAKNYCQFEYVNEELPDLFATSSIVLSRAGANTLYELLALKKPHILVPLPAKASRGDQLLNARYFHHLGISEVVQDSALNEDTLLRALDHVMTRKEDIIQKINDLNIRSAVDKITAIIKEQARV